MKKAIIGSLLVLVGATIALAGQRAANSYKATKISTTTVLVSCQDEREPRVSKVAETSTAILVTCRMDK